jgi:hypothetical protein
MMNFKKINELKILYVHGLEGGPKGLKVQHIS